MSRTAARSRTTKETSIEVTIDLDGTGLTDVSRQHAIPVGFGVLTVDTLQQAIDRAGGSAGSGPVSRERPDASTGIGVAPRISQA